MITQRYTPPTCTLEVTAQQPWLSRLRGESVLEDVQFQLSFDDPRRPKEEYIRISGDRHQLQELSEVVHRYVQQFLKTPVQPNAIFQVPAYSSDTDIHFKSDGVLYHHLLLGALATQPTPSEVHLSALQLFDLDTALQDCITELAEVPTRETIPSPILPLARAVVTVLVSIGALTGLIKLINTSRQEPAPVVATETATPVTPVDEVVSLPPPNLLSSPTPTLKPLPTPTPTPPAPETLSPNLPSVTTAPLPVPSAIFLDPANSSPTPTPFPAETPRANQFVIIPNEPTPSQSPVAPVQPAATPSTFQLNHTPTPGPSVPIAGGQVPSVIQLPPLQNPGTPIVVNTPPTDAEIENQPEEESVSYLTQLNKRPQTLAARRAEETTLFDQIPQVAEVRNYFQQNWYPPKSLQRSLQYRLQLNGDGSIQSITPIGQPSVNRLQQVEFPPTGEPFVSPIEPEEPVKIRIILQPNGQVQSFLET